MCGMRWFNEDCRGRFQKIWSLWGKGKWWFVVVVVLVLDDILFEKQLFCSFWRGWGEVVGGISWMWTSWLVVCFLLRCCSFSGGVGFNIWISLVLFSFLFVFFFFEEWDFLRLGSISSRLRKVSVFLVGI